MKRALLILALVAVVALPFVLRPARRLVARADETLVIITPHNEAIRYEFGRAFATWYHARTGRTVAIDWRVVGGTSDIARFLEGEYTTAFERHWTHTLGRPWSVEVQAGFQNPRSSASGDTVVRDARAAFLASEVGCGIDVFFGGDAYQFSKEADAGRLVASGLPALHPDWFRDDVIPQSHGGETFWDRDGRWFGVVLSSYGIVFNRDSWQRLGFARDPADWRDLADPRLTGEIALADPTKSGSVNEAFENIIQREILRRLAAGNTDGATAAAREAAAVREGWTEALRLIQRIGANARYFTDSSQKPPIDVGAGDCAAGLCIDFYGRQQQEAIRRRAASPRIGYVSPAGGSAFSTDPIGLLRGAPHRALAVAFLEFTLSLEGQKLWAFRPGTPGGPERFALRRIPVRRDFYAHPEWTAWRSDPEDAPYAAQQAFVYHPEWTGNLFREIGFVIRVMCEDTHIELVRAWRAINAAPEPQRRRALAVLQDLSAIGYERTSGEIHRRLGSSDKVDEVRLARELADWFRANYARAELIARGP
jgi:iron(III) transport system substrate-binding protein